MKIAFDVSQTCATRAGCAWFADSLAHALSRLLNENDQLQLYHHYARWINQDTTQGTHIHNPRVINALEEISPQEAKEMFVKISEGKKELPNKPDIFHANNFDCQNVGNTKLVYTVYDTSFFVHPTFSTEENRLKCQQGILDSLSHADAYVFISHYTKKEFNSLFPGVLERKNIPTLVTHLGARGKLASHPLPPKKKDFWLAVGTLEPRKNYETLLEALEIYWKKSLLKKPLYIAGGSGWKSEKLQNSISLMEKKGMVKYKGYVDDNTLDSLYKNAFAFIFPSWYEGFGLPVLEAMTQGTPVICSDRASIPEIGGEAVLYAKPHSAEEIANQMLNLESNNDIYYRELQEKCLQQASLFSWEKTAKELFYFYQSLL